MQKSRWSMAMVGEFPKWRNFSVSERSASPLEIKFKGHCMTSHVSSAEYGGHGEEILFVGGKHLQGDVPCERALFAQSTGELLIATSGDGFKSEPHAPPPAR